MEQISRNKTSPDITQRSRNVDSSKADSRTKLGSGQAVILINNHTVLFASLYSPWKFKEHVNGNSTKTWQQNPSIMNQGNAKALNTTHAEPSPETVTDPMVVIQHCIVLMDNRRKWINTKVRPERREWKKTATTNMLSEQQRRNGTRPRKQKEIPPKLDGRQQT